MARVRAGIYQRISDDRAGSGLGVTRQETDNRKLAASRSWDVVASYTDNDLSAFKGKVRPAYEEMMAAVERGDLDAVVAWHPDRLHRSPKELERFIDTVEAASVRVATVQGGEYDLSTASGRMTARIVGAVARHESEHKGERSRRKHQELAEAGKPGGGGTRAFGFELDRVTHRHDEAEIVRDIAQRIVAGQSIRGVASDLAARDIKTSAGNDWSPWTLRRLLQSPRIAGLREREGATWPAAWEPIIDQETWLTLRRILDDPGRRTNWRARSYLLAGLGHCGLCDAKLVARPRSDKRRCYVCARGPGFTGCGKIRVLADPLEDWVLDRLLAAVSDESLERALSRRSEVDRSNEGVTAELAGIETRLDELAEMWATGDLDRQSWQSARKRLTERREALLARLDTTSDTAALRSLTSAGGDLRARWASLSFDKRRAILSAVVARVVVGPAVRGRNFFDTERISVEWKT